MNKESIVFYKDWWEAIKRLPEEMRIEAVAAVMEYAFADVEPTDPILSFATTYMRDKIDRDCERFSEICRKRREAADKRWQKKREAKKQDSDPSTEHESSLVAPPEKQVESAVAGEDDWESKELRVRLNNPESSVTSEEKNASGCNCMQVHANGYDALQTNTTQSLHEHEHEHEHGHEHGKINENIYLQQQQDKSCCESAKVDVVVEDSLVEEFFASDHQASLESLSMNLRCDIAEMKRMAVSIVDEWKLKGETHADYKSAAGHLINVLRRKVNDPNERRLNPSTQSGALGVGEWIDDKGSRRYGHSDVIVPNDAPPRPTRSHYWCNGLWVNMI